MDNKYSMEDIRVQQEERGVEYQVMGIIVDVYLSCKGAFESIEIDEYDAA